MGLTDSIAWTFNIRGSDIAHNPVTLAYAILPATGKPTLFIDGRKLSNAVRDALSELAEIREPSTLGASLVALGRSGAKVMLDPAATADAIAAAIRQAGGTVTEAPYPAVLPKARRNAVELAGARRAHIRDGATMVRFLAWMDAGGSDGHGGRDRCGGEAAGVARRDRRLVTALSWSTFPSTRSPASAPTAPSSITASRRRPRVEIAPDTLYLVDSGAQYRDGTTDITPTIAIGLAERGDVLLLHPRAQGSSGGGDGALPAGTSGAQIDRLARQFLWQAGLDFDHGTGHGIGSFLNVHEGPARISKLGTVPLEAGMILSDEPGYYKTGAYGIRIENLIVVTGPQEIPGGDRPMLGFETITLAPIDRRLIEPALMTSAEIAWLDAYHASLADKLDHLLDGKSGRGSPTPAGRWSEEPPVRCPPRASPACPGTNSPETRAAQDALWTIVARHMRRTASGVPSRLTRGRPVAACSPIPACCSANAAAMTWSIDSPTV